MDTRMTPIARAELANAIRRRYCAATGRDKRRILDEFIATTGYHEKSAIRLLNRTPLVPHRQTRRRPLLYAGGALGGLGSRLRKTIKGLTTDLVAGLGA